MLATAFVLVLLAAAFAAGWAFARRTRTLSSPASPSPSPPRPDVTVRCDAGFARSTPEWRVEMERVGHRLAEAGVAAVVFAHGTFTGTDPLSAYGVVERALPAVGRHVGRALRTRTRRYVERLLGDLGNFGEGYARTFEEATGGSIPCTAYVWSSENHHVGRLEGALGLVRVLATHAELAKTSDARAPRLLVCGHSHAGQVFALVSQLLARSVATEAVLDVARARGLDVGALEVDLDALARVDVDFVTFGAPARYAWAKLDRVRVLHVTSERDWIQRLGEQPSDFPALSSEERRINASLQRSPLALAEAGEPGERVFVDYGAPLVLQHACYTRLDNMLFHAKLVADRLYPEPAIVVRQRPPKWLRAS